MSMGQLSIRTRRFTIRLTTAHGTRPLRSLLEWESPWAFFGAVVGVGVVGGVAATSTLTAITISIAIPTSAVVIASILSAVAIVATSAAVTVATSAVAIASILSAAEINGNTIQPIAVELRTEIEILQTGSVATRVETLLRIVSKAHETRS